MTLDALDRAFVSRWQARLDAAARATVAERPGEPDSALPAARVDEAPPPPAEASDVAADTSLVARLLAAGHGQWQALADEVEAARLAGHRVIAVTGGEQGEGRTTLVACLARALRDRGRDVVVHASTATLAGCDGLPADGGRLNDKRIVLVDAGIWFPPGPIRRHRLLVAGVGCDAAILVRRADREPAPVRATALAAVGVAPLGEVVTFAPTHRGAD